MERRAQIEDGFITLILSFTMVTGVFVIFSGFINLASPVNCPPNFIFDCEEICSQFPARTLIKSDHNDPIQYIIECSYSDFTSSFVLLSLLLYTSTFVLINKQKYLAGMLWWAIVEAVSIISILATALELFQNDTELRRFCDKNNCQYEKDGTSLSFFIMLLITETFLLILWTYNLIISRQNFARNSTQIPAKTPNPKITLKLVSPGQLSTSSEKVCPICLDTISEKNHSFLECHHKFHYKCIKDWLVRKQVCPLCRALTTAICLYDLPESEGIDAFAV